MCSISDRICGGVDCGNRCDDRVQEKSDTESATSLQVMRQASKNIMYTVVNSRAYSEEALDAGLPGWQIAAIVIDVIIALAIIGLEVLIVKRYRMKKS